MELHHTHGAISCIFHTLCTYDICFWKERPMWGNYCDSYTCAFSTRFYIYGINEILIIYLLLSISYSFQCQNLLLLFQIFWTHCIRINTILTKCRNDSTGGSCSLFFCISYVTCDPAVASSGFLSSLILRYRGKRSEMPFSGSTWWPRREWHHKEPKLSTLSCYHDLYNKTSVFKNTVSALWFTCAWCTDQSHRSLVDGRQWKVSAFHLPHLHRLQPHIRLCWLVHTIIWTWFR